MRLLLDHNLSPRLIARLSGPYAGVSHVALVGLERATDEAVWEYAAANDYAIITKDADFAELSVLRGSPPKVVWLRMGNCTTDDVARVLAGAREVIDDFTRDEDAGVLELL
ncbi:MAG TPA: DUF5615 family PIN-like protein [Chloroflexota bacterium]|nr:DUF5615 family PIN-like protein [Chloroflexota bacterium]